MVGVGALDTSLCHGSIFMNRFFFNFTHPRRAFLQQGSHCSLFHNQLDKSYFPSDAKEFLTYDVPPTASVEGLSSQLWRQNKGGHCESDLACEPPLTGSILSTGSLSGTKVSRQYSRNSPEL